MLPQDKSCNTNSWWSDLQKKPVNLDLATAGIVAHMLAGLRHIHRHMWSTKICPLLVSLRASASPIVRGAVARMKAMPGFKDKTTSVFDTQRQHGSIALKTAIPCDFEQVVAPTHPKPTMQAVPLGLPLHNDTQKGNDIL